MINWCLIVSDMFDAHIDEADGDRINICLTGSRTSLETSLLRYRSTYETQLQRSRIAGKTFRA